MKTTEDQLQDPELQRSLAALPAEVQPPRDLWAGVARRIDGHRPSSVRPRRLAAGSAVLLAAACVALAITGARRMTAVSSPLAATAGRELLLPVPVADLGPAAPEEARYQAAIAALRGPFEQRATMLSATDAAAVHASLEAIDSAIRATHQALELSPDDEDLRAELDDEYEQELQTLNDVLDWTTRS